MHIYFKEARGCEGRGQFFDNNGIVRDVMQNHMMQIFSFMAMECPTSLDARTIADQKTKFLEEVEPVDPKDCLYGQYTASDKGKGYREEETVLDKNSTTPTYCACVLRVRNQRWECVPFLLKAGKALNENLMEIRIRK